MRLPDPNLARYRNSPTADGVSLKMYFDCVGKHGGGIDVYRNCAFRSQQLGEPCQCGSSLQAAASSCTCLQTPPDPATATSLVDVDIFLIPPAITGPAQSPSAAPPLVTSLQRCTTRAASVPSHGGSINFGYRGPKTPMVVTSSLPRDRAASTGRSSAGPLVLASVRLIRSAIP